MMAQLPENSWLENVRRTIVDNLSRDASVQAIAAALDMSPRTLQRQLKALGTSHRKEVEEIRRDLAARYLLSSRLSVSEVALLLGYADANTFCRAFARWFDSTPGRFRADSRPVPGSAGDSGDE